MFSLIVVIISIALVAALAVATIYYGGIQFNKGAEKAAASTVINQAQQIDSAVQLFKLTEGSAPASLTDLVSQNYLSRLPSGDWQLVGQDAVRVDLSANQCLAANQQLGINTVPTCSDPAYANVQVCCSL